MVLYINCANHVPGVKFGHAPGVDSLHRPTIGKTKKIFFSETTRPTALIFGMYQWLMVLYINCAIHDLASPRRLIVSIDLLWEKNSKIFFSETTGHTALIFCMWQWLMVLYINCASHAPEVKFGHAPGVDSSHRLTMGKTNKNLLL